MEGSDAELVLRVRRGDWAGKMPEIEALIDSTRTEIRSLLSPEQREAYERWVARQRAPAPNP
jgi:hypothetical protein